MIVCRSCNQTIQGCTSKPYREDYSHRDADGNPTYICPACHGGK
jgi:hypothetical protein